ncbi:MAG: helix-turn-helix domain-containing protein [Ruminococcus sp.]
MHHKTDMGTFIRDRRKALGIDQCELEERCGISQAHISRMENGISFPSFPSVLKLARGLQVPVSELVAVAESKTQEKAG